MSLDEALHDDKQADLEIARHLAELAGPIALSYFRGDNRTWSKADGSPVSAADMAVDRAIRDELGRLRPEDGILTEEGEEVGAGQRRRWIIDPIDGTREFVAGRGDWGTNVALDVNGVITVGLMTRPVHRLRWWAQRGTGAFFQDRDLEPTQVHVSSRHALGECRLSAWPDVEPTGTSARVRSVETWVAPDMTLLPKLLAGELEAVFAMRADPWDFAPGVVLVEEAGGRFQDPAGGRSIFLGSGIFSNGLIDEHVRQLLHQESTRQRRDTREVVSRHTGRTGATNTALTQRSRSRHNWLSGGHLPPPVARLQATPLLRADDGAGATPDTPASGPTSSTASMSQSSQESQDPGQAKPGSAGSWTRVSRRKPTPSFIARQS